MTASLGSLVVSLGLDAAEYFTGMGKAEQQAKRTSDKLARDLTGAMGAVKATLASLGAVVSVGAIVNLGLSAARAVDDFNDLKDATGASIENISALDRVARETGGNFDTVSSAVIKFNKLLNGAGEEGSSARAIIAGLGLDVDKLKLKDPIEGFLDLSVAMGKFADDGAKGRAILELTGKSVKDMAPLMKDLADKGILVAITSTEAAEEAERFRKALSSLKADSEDLARSITLDVVVSINNLVKAFRDLRGMVPDLSFLKPSKEFMEFVTPRTSSTGGATGSWGAPVDPRPSLGSPGGNKPKTGGVAKDPYAEAKRYLESLEKQAVRVRELSAEEELLIEIQSKRLAVTPQLQAQLEAAARQLDLTREARKLDDERMHAQRALAIEAGDAVNKANDEYQKWLEQMKEAGPEGQLEKTRQTMLKLRDAFEAGDLSPEQFSDAAAGVLGLNAALEQADNYAKTAAENIQGYFGQGLYDIMTGNFKNIASSFTQMINRMVAEAAAANLARFLLGDMVKGGSGEGAIGGIFKSITTAIFGGPKASGGPVAPGTLYQVNEQRPELLDVNGRQYLMMGSRGGRIDPNPRLGAAGGGNTIIVQVTAPQGTSRSSAMQWGATAAQQLQRAATRNT